ncbi:hypothetical protein [Streptomyces sp. A012304]|uniref:hypothetical protein n=1 Tax=Streptomyces sp. A012304 TaxID=375446 RepID=UPI00222F2D9F|nr:hypothetical protein [Streptomyces sp. A012304]GKQ36392.1 hypothetical protein ALMP_29350 [Streptomyces sp. A012304]
MNHGADSERDFEELVRELMTDDAYTIQPSAAPYQAIRRRGLVERRRRIAVTGAALVGLAAVPAGAYAVAGGNGGGDADPTTPMSSVSAPQSPTPSAPEQAASGGLLLDGVTVEQAEDGLEKCLAYDDAKPSGGLEEDHLGTAGDYRIILGMHSTGDSNAPGDGIYVVAVKEKTDVRLICTIKGGEATGINISSPDNSPTGTVVPDINSGKLYQQSYLDKGNWKLPFRWGIIGTVQPSVAEVTVSYGDSEATATLDDGWFVAAGILHQQVTLAPHIKGYDAAGKLVYDSDTDESYEKNLP